MLHTWPVRGKSVPQLAHSATGHPRLEEVEQSANHERFGQEGRILQPCTRFPKVQTSKRLVQLPHNNCASPALFSSPLNMMRQLTLCRASDIETVQRTCQVSF